MVVVYWVEEPRTIQKDVHYKRKVHRRKVHYITNEGKQGTRDVVVDSQGNIKSKRYEKQNGVNSAADAKDYLKQHKPRPRVARIMIGPPRNPAAQQNNQRRRRRRHGSRNNNA